MRVLQMGGEWPAERPGGANTYFAELLTALTRQNVDVPGLVVGSGQVSVLTKGQVSAFAEANSSIPWRMWRARQAAQAALEAAPVDLIASHFALYAASLGGLLLKRPSVVHFHGPWAFESDFEGAKGLSARAKATLERSVYAKARRCIVLSHAFQRVLSEGYGIPEDRIRIIPGGVDVARFNCDISRASARERLGWSNDRMILVCVRRLVRRMGLENLIATAARLASHDFVLYIGGTGALTPELKAQIRDLGLDQKVKLLGRISDEDLPLVYRAADLSVVPSQALEGFGLIALESLASGTPVFVTPIGGLPEVVRPFAPECVFRDASVEAMAAVLAGALDGSLPMPAERACRGYATDHFSWGAVAGRVIAVYEEAIGSV